MTGRVSAEIAREVRRRASQCCEYCRLPQASQEATFHIDHVKPQAAGGSADLDNLALACVTCSLRKGARRRVPDPQVRRLALLFNPRRQSWADHFRWTRNWRVIGLTPTGRATVSALGMNRPAIVAIRQLLVRLKRFPPSLD